mgnify:CR=1 FL=1
MYNATRYIINKKIKKNKKIKIVFYIYKQKPYHILKASNTEEKIKRK